ncbi:hypothetical protein MNKW57_00980 [Biformimicrobium ophioploci]|uniref:Uncharacterized protein n=1 Tax=Biformimicrobium ophioploci TaxID=3036711 RepID=A0ABQ6LUP9_9GAMM|nr:hypothetical protein MNKW57_00980 [Microbulbifer sp. NKW57]
MLQHGLFIVLATVALQRIAGLLVKQAHSRKDWLGNRSRSCFDRLLRSATGEQQHPRQEQAPV